METSGLTIGCPIFPSKKERFCCSAPPDSGPRSMPIRRPAARLSTITVIVSVVAFFEPRRRSVRSAARVPRAAGSGMPFQKREPPKSYSSGRRPSASCALTPAERKNDVPRLEPEKPFDVTIQLSPRLLVNDDVTLLMALLPWTARAAS
jgi:hypothetical protein